MRHTTPRFSIVIPCYNEAQYIEGTLQSLRSQRFTGKYEIIVVDNNCTDETVAIAKSYGVRVVTESRPGVCWARQAGTEAARGEIVISTDADTIYPKSWLSTIDQLFTKRPDCVAVTGPCRYHDGPWWGRQYPKLLFGAVSLLAQLIGHPFYVTATNIAFKKSAWTEYHTVMTQGGDELGLLHDLEKHGKVIFCNANPVYTSARRLTKGLIYNLFVTFLYYYFIAYYLNRYLGRPVIGTAPAYRGSSIRRNRVISLAKYTAVVTLLLFAAAVIHLPHHDTLLEHSREILADVGH